MNAYLSPIYMAVPVVCLTWIIVHCLIASRVKTFPAVVATLSVILGLGIAGMIVGAETPYRIVLLAVLLFSLGYCTYIWAARKLSLRRVWAFYAKGEEAKLLEIRMALAVTGILVIGLKTALHASAAPSWVPALFSGLFALTLCFWAFFALFGTKEFVGKKDVRTAFRFNSAEQENTAAPVEEQKQAAPQSLASALFNAPSQSWEDKKLVSRFQHVMIDEQVFLQPGLTIGDMAERLHTNKNYISRMVNQTYNIGFPEVLNILRIDYAEQFIVNHKDLNQDEIARACGFVSATYFNSTFKRITGFTPKVWASKGTL